MAVHKATLHTQANESYKLYLHWLMSCLQVEEMEGRTAAVQNGCQFFEVSVAENSADLYQAFEMLVNECRCSQGNNSNGHHKSRKFSVSKMIGTLIGSSSNSNGKNGNIGSQTQQQNQGGTVVVCQKSDLHRSRVLKRRQNFTATASL
jgi:Ras-related and estrogen-regulated growth inhibitor-like protein